MRKRVGHVLVESNVVVLKVSPVAPLERNGRGAAVHLEDFPGKRGHHALKGLVALAKVVVLRVVVLVGRDKGVVSAHAQHVLARLRRPAVEAECVAGLLDGAPVGQVGLEGSLDFPVLDEILNEVLEAARCVVCRLFYSSQVVWLVHFVT